MRQITYSIEQLSNPATQALTSSQQDPINLIPVSPHFQLAQPIIINGQLNSAAFIQEVAQYQLFQIGVDEVGRGPLYGSVVVAACLLPSSFSKEIIDMPLQGTVLQTLTDSKKLSEKKREQLFPLLQQQALGFVLVEVPAAVIDQVNILQATLTGMRLASECLLHEVAAVVQQTVTVELLFDGNQIPKLDWQMLNKQGVGMKGVIDNKWVKSANSVAVTLAAWVKGDGRHTAMAAASVLAKVTRDRQMVQDDIKYPGYGLAQHKGYPTKAHMAALQTFGVLPQHRQSFKPVQQVLQKISSKS